MCDMFLILNTSCFSGYADGNSPFMVRSNITDVMKALEEIAENILNWFLNNEINLNTDKQTRM